MLTNFVECETLRDEIMADLVTPTPKSATEFPDWEKNSPFTPSGDMNFWVWNFWFARLILL